MHGAPSSSIGNICSSLPDGLLPGSTNVEQLKQKYSQPAHVRCFNFLHCIAGQSGSNNCLHRNNVLNARAHTHRLKSGMLHKHLFVDTFECDAHSAQRWPHLRRSDCILCTLITVDNYLLNISCEAEDTAPNHFMQQRFGISKT